MYCDTTGAADPKKYAERMLERKKKGFTFFKMDVTTNFISGNGNTGAIDPPAASRPTRDWPTAPR